MEQAIEFEARRQIELIEDGKAVVQETRLYDPDKDETRSMRSKEDAQDYRYFPDPDLLPLVISEADIERVKATMPALPETKRQEFIAYGIPSTQASQLTSSIEMSTYALRAFSKAPKEGAATIANWITGPLSSKLNDENLDISQSKVSADVLSALFSRVADGTISGSTAVGKVMTAMWSGEGSPDEIIEKRGLKQISDSGEIEKYVDDALAANPKLVEDFRSGKEKAFNALVGQVMKRSQGKANPAQVNEILRRKLKAG
jgi:aspartyl-tRNA(Asn)/glutamyl-tRNA(Gln) amidotransferase subunit B